MISHNEKHFPWRISYEEIYAYNIGNLIWCKGIWLQEKKKKKSFGYTESIFNKFYPNICRSPNATSINRCQCIFSNFSLHVERQIGIKALQQIVRSTHCRRTLGILARVAVIFQYATISMPSPSSEFLLEYSSFW